MCPVVSCVRERRSRQHRGCLHAGCTIHLPATCIQAYRLQLCRVWFCGDVARLNNILCALLSAQLWGISGWLKYECSACPFVWLLQLCHTYGVSWRCLLLRCIMLACMRGSWRCLRQHCGR